MRIADVGANWRFVYHIATDAIVILEVFAKKTQTTPKSVIDDCQKRLEMFRRATTMKKGNRHAR